MTDKKPQKRDWVDIALKAATPILAGVLIAWAGFVGDWLLSSTTNRQESARLITELQIKREQAESELRKDVFNQALDAFLLGKSDNPGTLKDMSKQLLRLELLSLNFGDSLSLSPLFAEFRNDLDRSRPVTDEERRDYKERKGELRKRLESLAKRVASTQLSSIAQHGKIKQIDIPLRGYTQLIENEDAPCKKTLYEDSDYAWPDYDILSQMGALDSNHQPTFDYESDEFFRESAQQLSLIELSGIKRYLQLRINDVDHCKKTARIQIILVKDDPELPEVNRTFTLNYFNFPMVDNTRLSENQRFAIVMETFNLSGNRPHIEIAGVIFPSEYASLRDRPGMQEARKLLESALEDRGQ